MADEIKIDVIAATKKAEKNIEDFNKRLERLEKNTEKNQKATLKWKSGLAALGVGLAGVGLAMSKAVDLASDLEETTNKFQVVFQGVTQEANKMADALVNSYNMSTLESKKLLSSTGDLLTGLGVGRKTALDMSFATQKLAADLASFTNIEGGAKRASEALTSGLLGEREAMKALGIVINENMIKQELARQGQDKLTGSALLQAKAQATLTLAMQQSKNAIGDLARSSDSYANVSRRLTNKLQDVGVVIGQLLMPVFKFFKQLIIDVINWFMGLDKSTQMIILGVTAAAVAIGVLTTAIKALGIAWGKAFKWASIIVGAISVLVGAFLWAKKNWTLVTLNFRLGMEKVKRWFKVFGQAIKLFWMWLADVMIGLALKILTPFVKGVDLIIKGINKVTGKNIALLENGLTTIQTLSASMVAKEKAKLQEVSQLSEAEVQIKKDIAQEKARIVQKELEDELNKRKESNSQIIQEEQTKNNAIVQSGKAAADKLKEFAQQINENVFSPMGQLRDSFTGVVSQYQEMTNQIIEEEKLKQMAIVENEHLSAIDSANKKLAEFQKRKAAEEAIELKDESAKKARDKRLADEEKKLLKQQKKAEEQQKKELEEIEKEYQQRVKDEKYKQAKVNKALSLVDAKISVAQAIVKALTAGPIIGPILAGVVGVLGAAKIAMIASTPIPKAAEGGLIPGSSLGTNLIAGEGGRQEAIIPLENPRAMDKLKEGLGGLTGGGVVVNLNADTIIADDDLPMKLAEKIDEALYNLNRNGSSAFAESIQ